LPPLPKIGPHQLDEAWLPEFLPAEVLPAEPLPPEVLQPEDQKW
jgi:hypothetical protein